jgi:hypothetical protein
VKTEALIAAIDEVESIANELDDGPGDYAERAQLFCTRYPVALAEVRRQICSDPLRAKLRLALRLHPVDDPRCPNWLTTIAMRDRFPFYMTELRDGTVGFLQRRVDDCFQAAIASCAQVSPYLVPDLKMQQQTAAGKDPEQVVSAALAKLDGWMDENGVAIRFHASPPWSARRWIGVIRDPRPMSDHCLLMSGRVCLFDGARALPKDHDEPASDFDPADIDYGITIE